MKSANQPKIIVLMNDALEVIRMIENIGNFQIENFNLIIVFEGIIHDVFKKLSNFFTFLTRFLFKLGNYPN